MEVYRSSAEAAGRLRRPALAIGNFDGVHLGHQALCREVVRLAGGEGTPAVLTFDPHPARFFNPELAPPLICTEAQKLALLARHGVAATVVERFDADLAALTPEAFVARVLVERLGVAHVVVGEGFVFGRGRSGDLATLRRLGERHGFAVHGVPPVTTPSGLVVSSTKIRELILLGRVRGAAELLGREHLVEGVVVRGAGRGRTIGVPTANLAPEGELLPARGVYAAWAHLPGGRRWPAVVNVGTAPTVRTDGGVTVEAHLIGFEGELLGRRLGLGFARRLRPERRFASVEELVAAIRADIARGREILGDPPAEGA